MFYQESDDRQYVKECDRLKEFQRIVKSKKHLNYYVECFSAYWSFYDIKDFEDNKHDLSSNFNNIIEKSEKDLLFLTKFKDFSKDNIAIKYARSMSNLKTFERVFIFEQKEKFNKYLNNLISQNKAKSFIKKILDFIFKRNYFEIHHLHKTPKKIIFNSLPEDLKKEIIEKTKYDYKIYNYFKDKSKMFCLYAIYKKDV